MNLNIKCPPLFKAALLFAAVHTVCPVGASNHVTAKAGAGKTISSSASRGRVSISNGTIVTDRGTLLRGCRVSTDMTERLPQRSAISSIKRYGLNAIHLYAESFVKHKPGELHALVDSLVIWTAQDSLYLVLTIGCIDQNGRYDHDFATGFWNYYAPRYADQTHVIYEIHNEPHAWSPPYPDSTLGMEREAHAIIRSHAPLTHVLFFSYGVPSNSEGILRDIQKLGTGVDWGNCSVATHGYGTTYAELDTVIRAVQHAGYGIVNTEPCFMRIDDDCSMQLFRQQMRVHEDNHVSYLHFHDAEELKIPGHFQTLVEEAGISWEPDFGTWPVPVTWNAFSPVQAEFYSSQGGAWDLFDMDWFQFTPVSTAVGLEPGEIPLPITSRLEQNYPNHFNSNTTICFTLSESADISLSIFDLRGKKLLNPANGKYPPGEYALTWPSENLSSGIYIYQLTAGPFHETRKMIMQK